MSIPLFLFCGGPAIYGVGRPKPLMPVGTGSSLLVHFLQLLQRRGPVPSSVTLLCDEGQQAWFYEELQDLNYPVPVHVRACGGHCSTLDKFAQALTDVQDAQARVRFGYPDIFYFGVEADPDAAELSDGAVCISAAALTSRFPRLVLDVYQRDVKGISNHSSPVPANPMHVFGGDVWGQVGILRQLHAEFRAQTSDPSPSLEYDFFFWLINRRCMRSVLLYGERLWVDSLRDVHRLQQCLNKELP